MTEKSIPSVLTRRDFLTRSAAAGMVLGAPGILHAQSKTPSDTLNVAMIGFGKQGLVLFEAMQNIPGIRVTAVCDISNWQLGIGAKRVSERYKERPARYSDIDDMLAKEKNLDCAIVATPDFWHAPHTIKCLEAGLHVYCEKMMAHTIDAARDMVHAMERTGKLCQIGHQRRSNARYRFTLEQLINRHKICGQITSINGQWNRSLSASKDIGGGDEKMHRNIIVRDDVLQRYGYKNMHQFLNWRTYRDLSGGPISDLGAHQIDIFNWFLGGPPKRVYASGSNPVFKHREHFDNVMCLFDYDTPQGEVTAFYQVLTTTGAGRGFYETFMGTEGTLTISEIAAHSAIYREGGNDDTEKSWADLVDRGFLKRVSASAAAKPTEDAEGAVASYASAAPEAYDLPGVVPLARGRNGKLMLKPAHMPHIENFFAAVRGEESLNCDARHAFESEAPVFWVNPSALAKEPINLTTEHLSV
ncbi:MAG: Gfo/Idh/MocA family protein [Luteolibacter sp.]